MSRNSSASALGGEVFTGGELDTLGPREGGEDTARMRKSEGVKRFSREYITQKEGRKEALARKEALGEMKKRSQINCN